MRTLTLLLLLGSSQSAFAAMVSLGVPVRGQETGKWCWAASTEMVGNYFGSNSLEQCKMANVAYGRPDCCTTPTNCDNSGESFSEAAEYWGFPHTNYDTAPLSYSQIKAKIDNGQPVVTRFEWTGTGAHFVVVDGYNSSANTLEVINPLPVGSGDREVVTYSEYLTGGSGTPYGTHTVTNSYYSFEWDPVCSYDFHDLPDEDYQQCFDQRSGRGQHPSAIASGCEGSCDARMGGAFHNSSSPWVAWNNSRTDIEDFVDDHSTSYRPEMITVRSGSTPKYSTILTPSSGTWTTHYSLDSTTFQNTFVSLGNNGWRLKDLFGYRDGSTPKFSGTWVQESGSYIANHALLLSSLEATDDDNRALGYMLTRLSIYLDSNNVWRAAALWQPSTVSDYRIVYGKSASEYQTAYTTKVNNGYTLAYMSKYNGNYNAIFTK